LRHARERCDRPSASRIRTWSGGVPMARNNYGFEKRQRELLKERKKEEKRQKKLERSNADQVVDSTTQEPGEGSEPDSSS
jgi:hypothetical protein